MSKTPSATETAVFTLLNRFPLLPSAAQNATRGCVANEPIKDVCRRDESDNESSNLTLKDEAMEARWAKTDCAKKAMRRRFSANEVRSIKFAFFTPKNRLRTFLVVVCADANRAAFVGSEAVRFWPLHVRLCLRAESKPYNTCRLPVTSDQKLHSAGRVFVFLFTLTT